MNKLVTITVILSFVIIGNLSAQVLKKTENPNYYWFNLKIKPVIHKETHKPTVGTKRIYPKIYSGSFGDYEDFLKKNIAHNKVTIGPFVSKELAIEAKKCYKISKNLYDNEAEEFIRTYPVNEGIYHWYFTRIKLDDDGSLIFERMPARISYGSLKEFLQILYEGLSFENFLIGPFKNYLNGEKSKYVFRKHGELNENTEDVIKSNELTIMADKWKEIKITAQKSKVLNNDDTLHLTIKIEFPPKYFSKKTIQYFNFSLIGKDKTVQSLKSTTLQGEWVEDNNPVISFDEGRAKEFKFKLKEVDLNNSKIQIRSTLFSYTEMFECENIYLETTD